MTRKHDQGNTIGSQLGRYAWGQVREQVKEGEKARVEEQRRAAREKRRKAKAALKPHVSEKLRKHKERY